jgi:hypothetical protein
MLSSMMMGIKLNTMDGLQQQISAENGRKKEIQ